MPTAVMSSPLGALTLDVDADEHLVSLDVAPIGETIEPVTPPGTAATVAALGRYFDGDVAAIDEVTTAPDRGTAFQRSVWSELRRIPAGATITYGQLAERIGRPTAVRAVGSANGANPVPIVVPCHRVVAAGGLGGYALGLDRKRWLLGHERRG